VSVSWVRFFSMVAVLSGVVSESAMVCRLSVAADGAGGDGGRSRA
jgi:hypothetical protein